MQISEGGVNLVLVNVSGGKTLTFRLQGASQVRTVVFDTRGELVKEADFKETIHVPIGKESSFQIMMLNSGISSRLVELFFEIK